MRAKHDEWDTTVYDRGCEMGRVLCTTIVVLSLVIVIICCIAMSFIIITGAV